MRRYKTILSLLLILIIIAFAMQGVAFAHEEGFDNPPPMVQREKVRERIQTLRIWRLTKALDLDEATASRLFPLLNSYDKKRFRLERAIRNDMRALKDALDKKEMAELQEILQRVEDRHRELQRLNDEERAKLKEILTPEQQAKYLLFQFRFKRDIRRIIEKAKRRDLKHLPPPESPPEID